MRWGAHPPPAREAPPAPSHLEGARDKGTSPVGALALPAQGPRPNCPPGPIRPTGPPSRASPIDAPPLLGEGRPWARSRKPRQHPHSPAPERWTARSTTLAPRRPWVRSRRPRQHPHSPAPPPAKGRWTARSTTAAPRHEPRAQPLPGDERLFALPALPSPSSPSPCNFASRLLHAHHATHHTAPGKRCWRTPDSHADRRRRLRKLTNMLSQKRSTSQAPQPSTLLYPPNSPAKTAPKERRYMTPDSHASA